MEEIGTGGAGELEPGLDSGRRILGPELHFWGGETVRRWRVGGRRGRHAAGACGTACLGWVPLWRTGHVPRPFVGTWALRV